MKKNTIPHYKFTDTDAKPLLITEDYAPDFFLKRVLNSPFNFGANNIMSHGVYKEKGWAYNLRAYLKKYVYKQHGQWYESYAINKGNLRKLVRGRIHKIIEII